MRIAVLSGKGGTGKTFISVNLATTTKNSVYIDCDVEEPNGHIFFKPQQIKTQDIFINVPSIDKNKCNGCRTCTDFCKFNALAFINTKPMVFEDVCHSCGGCKLLCPQKAISEEKKLIGKIQQGISENIKVISGFLNPGQASGVPIIKELINKTNHNNLMVIDCPPGSACVVMESIKEADFCILIAEPTLFGAHNLNMVYELVKLFNKPYGVILNKCLDNINNPSVKFCKKYNIPILGEIPYTKELANINSNGMIAVRHNREYRDLFLSLLDKIKEVHDEKVVNP